MQVQPDRRRPQSRVPIGIGVRLVVDTDNGLVTTRGQLMDLSEGGFAVHLGTPIDTQHAGRVSLTVAGKAIWLPMITRWSRQVPGGWTVGCEFDRPTPEKQQAIRALLRGR